MTRIVRSGTKPKIELIVDDGFGNEAGCLRGCPTKQVSLQEYISLGLCQGAGAKERPNRDHAGSSAAKNLCSCRFTFPQPYSNKHRRDIVVLGFRS